MKKEYEKVCKYCGDPFIAERANKEYCSPTHAKYDHEVRKGRRERPARLESKGGYVPLSEGEIAEIQSRITILKKEIQKLNQAILQNHESETEDFEKIKSNIIELIPKKIRAIEQMNLLTRSMIDPVNMSGDQVKQYANSKFIYPFSEYEDYDVLFESFGNQYQPFKAVIRGHVGSGKTLLSLKIANHLIKHLNAKVLFVCSIEQENAALQYIRYFDSLNDNFAFRVLTSELQLRQELKKDKYEFLFLDPISNLVSHLSFFQDMLITYPRLSIFWTSEKLARQSPTVVDISFDIDVKINRSTVYQDEPISKVSFVKVLSNNQESELTVYHYQYPIVSELFDPINF